MTSTTHLLQRSALQSQSNTKNTFDDNADHDDDKSKRRRRRPPRSKQQLQQSRRRRQRRPEQSLPSWIVQQWNVIQRQNMEHSAAGTVATTCLGISGLILLFLLLLMWILSSRQSPHRRHHIQDSTSSSSWSSFLRSKQHSPLPPLHYQQQHHHHRHPYDRDGGSELQLPRVPTVRQVFEQTHPVDDVTRTQRAVQALRVDNPGAKGDNNNDNSNDNGSPDLYHCPEVPPASLLLLEQPQDDDGGGYPRTWPLLDLLRDWHPNDVQLPQPRVRFQSLCILDWNRHSMEQIQAYRQAEIPFVLQNHPQVWQAAERWNSNVTTTNNDKKVVPYLVELMGQEPPQRNEYAAQSNHLPFWRLLKSDNTNANNNNNNNKPTPTQNVDLHIREWFQHARALEQRVQLQRGDKNDTRRVVTTSDHYYFRFTATPTVHTYLYDELPLFRPQLQQTRREHDANKNHHKDHEPDLFMVEPQQERGINCRFGMIGSRADSHFDPTRNWIVVMGGQRRYILSPPQECPNLNLQPLSHMSARHAADDWGTDDWSTLQEPLRHAQALQVVLQPGDALYLPTSWFHFIVSLTTSFQCNARSGSTQHEGSKLHRIFQQCGFDVHV